jgi:hypothetical protein
LPAQNSPLCLPELIVTKSVTAAQNEQRMPRIAAVIDRARSTSVDHNLWTGSGRGLATAEYDRASIKDHRDLVEVQNRQFSH